MVETPKVNKIGIADLKVYAKKNPVKFVHKYGNIDLDNLPEGFENMIPYYKLLVARERSARERAGIPQDMPEITPWNILPNIKKPVTEDAEQTKQA